MREHVKAVPRAPHRRDPLQRRGAHHIQAKVEGGQATRPLHEEDGIQVVVVPAEERRAVVRGCQRKPGAIHDLLHVTEMMIRHIFRIAVEQSAGPPVDAVGELLLADRAEVGGTRGHRRVNRPPALTVVPRVAGKRGEAQREGGDDESLVRVVQKMQRNGEQRVVEPICSKQTEKTNMKEYGTTRSRLRASTDSLESPCCAESSPGKTANLPHTR